MVNDIIRLSDMPVEEVGGGGREVGGGERGRERGTMYAPWLSRP